MENLRANELRIGNYVNKITTSDNDADLTIINAIDIFNVSADIDFYEPITLTEEWLLNLGFEKVQLSTKCLYYRGLFCINKTHINFFTINRNFVAIKTVHQLQNIYHSIYGDELTLDN